MTASSTKNRCCKLFTSPVSLSSLLPQRSSPAIRLTSSRRDNTQSRQTPNGGNTNIDPVTMIETKLGLSIDQITSNMDRYNTGIHSIAGLCIGLTYALATGLFVLLQKSPTESVSLSPENTGFKLGVGAGGGFVIGQIIGKALEDTFTYPRETLATDPDLTLKKRLLAFLKLAIAAAGPATIKNLLRPLVTYFIMKELHPKTQLALLAAIRTGGNADLITDLAGAWASAIITNLLINKWVLPLSNTKNDIAQRLHKNIRSGIISPENVRQLSDLKPKQKFLKMLAKNFVEIVCGLGTPAAIAAAGGLVSKLSTIQSDITKEIQIKNHDLALGQVYKSLCAVALMGALFAVAALLQAGFKKPDAALRHYLGYRSPEERNAIEEDIFNNL